MSAFPISIKAVLLDPGGKVVLLKNDRDEWELPGGRLEAGEQPTRVVERELHEELGVRATCGRILDSWLFEVLPGREVLIVTYAATATGWEDLRHSGEHREVGRFSPDEIGSLPIPAGYLESIRRCLSPVTG